MKTTIKRIGIILLVSGVMALVANSVHPGKIPWVQDWSTQVEAKARALDLKVIPFSVALDKFQTGEVVFIDARPPGEYLLGHIPGSLSIPISLLDEKLLLMGNLIDTGKELVVYCRNRECDDSLMLATALQSMGCSNVVLYIDGFEMWKKHGGATSSSPADSEDTVPPAEGESR